MITGEPARYRVRPSGAQQVVSWAVGGGSVSQSADPARPDELLLVADRPGTLTVAVRLREGLNERRETKAVTAVPDETAATPWSRPFLRLVMLSAACFLATGASSTASMPCCWPRPPCGTLNGFSSVLKRAS